MAQGDKSSKQRLAGGKNKLTSSPNKVYASRASKPSGVAKVTLADADGTYSQNEQDLINALKAKVNELIDALKK